MIILLNPTTSYQLPAKLISFLYLRLTPGKMMSQTLSVFGQSSTPTDFENIRYKVGQSSFYVISDGEQEPDLVSTHFRHISDNGFILVFHTNPDPDMLVKYGSGFQGSNPHYESG